MADNEIPVNIRVHGKDEAQASLRDLGTTIGEVFAVAELIKFTKEGLSNFSKLDTASRELAASLHHQSDALVKLGIDSAKTSTMRAPEIIQGEKVLATYKMTEAQIKQMMPALLNLATRTGSISSAARLMGMSFENGSKHLGMFGINVHGTLGSQERLNSIIQQTTAALGDQNAAAYAAMNPLDKIKKSFAEISVSLGKAAAPEFEKMAKFFNDNQETFEHFAKFVGDNIEYIGLGVVSLAIMKAAPVIISQIKLISSAFIKTPWGAIALGVGVLAEALLKYHNDESIIKANEAETKRLATIGEAIAADRERIELDKGQLVWLDHQINKTQAQIDLQKVLRTEIEDTTKDMKERADALMKKGKDDVKPPPELAVGGKSAEAELIIKQEQEKIDTINKIKKEREEIGLNETEKALLEEQRLYEANTAAMLGDQQAIEEATDLHYHKLADIEQKATITEEKKQWDIINKGVEDNKKLMEKRNSARKKLDDMEGKESKKSLQSELKEVKNHYSEMLNLAKQCGASQTEIEKIQAEYRKASFKTEFDFKVALVDNYQSRFVTSLQTLADASKANAQVKKRLAEGEAVISSGKAALGIIENTGQYVSTFGPIAGPILEGVELAAVIAEAVMQVQKIESAKMAYGGVAHGGTPGVDSIPAMLMPGEVVYNPAHPNPALASMINGGMSNSNNQQTTHIHMAPIVVQGNASKTTTAEIGRVTQKALISALKEAQVNGNVSAPGLVVRH